MDEDEGVAGRRVRSSESTACCHAGEPGFDCGASCPNLALTACCHADEPGLSPFPVSICRLWLTHVNQAGEPNVALAGAAGVRRDVVLAAAGVCCGGAGDEQAPRANATAATENMRQRRMVSSGGGLVTAYPGMSRRRLNSH